MAAPVEESENYTETENSEQPADVSVLPGESLAKYRTKPAERSTSRHPFAAAARDTISCRKRMRPIVLPRRSRRRR